MTTPAPADALVVVGISGDLARKMTFLSLYRLEERGLLDVPLIGVAAEDWTVADLQQRARESVAATITGDVDATVMDRFCARMQYVGGDLTDPALYEKIATAVGTARTPVFYLEIPPFLFGPVVEHLAAVKLTAGARIVVEKPFGHDLASAQALNAELMTVLQEEQLYRIDHFLGKLSVQDIMHLRFANTLLEPIWNRLYIDCVQITMCESFGVKDRGAFYDKVGCLRDVVQNHLMQVLAMVAIEPPARGDADGVFDRKRDVFAAMPPADPTLYIRGQYEGYADTPGVAPGSTTETYSALRLEIDNWRWAGVPFLIRAGKSMGMSQTEVRVVFKAPPSLGFSAETETVEPNQVVLLVDPYPGARFSMHAGKVDGPGLRTIDLEVAFHSGDERIPQPYEQLLHSALIGDRAQFTREDGVEETWRVLGPLLDLPSMPLPYAEGSWGPAAADGLAAPFGGWKEPWPLSDAAPVPSRSTTGPASVSAPTSTAVTARKAPAKKASAAKKAPAAKAPAATKTAEKKAPATKVSGKKAAAEKAAAKKK